MHFERLTNTKHPRYKEALALYALSFPAHEQRESASQRAILQDPAYHFDLIYDGATFVGLILNWETENYIYVEHLCILPDMRNHRYGQRSLDLLKERKKPIILEIDPPIDDISIRRKGFYERCGFVSNPYTHIHPPYHMGNHGHDLVLMTCPGPISPSLCKAFQTYLQQHVMAHVF